MKRFRLPDGSGEIALRYLYAKRDRYGKARWYVRFPGKPLVRLMAEPGTGAFLEEHREALKRLAGGEAVEAAAPAPALPQNPAARPPRAGSWRWLCTDYFASGEFRDLDASTRKARRAILESTFGERIAPDDDRLYGDAPLAALGVAAIEILRDRKEGFPEAMNGRVKAMRQVFKWGRKRHPRLVAANPAREVAYISTGSDGWHSWTPEEIRAFVRRHPAGTRAYLALALLLFTGVRRSDVIRLGPQHETAAGTELAFKVHKGRRRKPVTLTMPILAPVRAAIDACPSGHMTYLATAFGKPFTHGGFGNWFKRRCREAGLPEHCSAHGVRKGVAAIGAENNMTEREMMAAFGWSTSKEAVRYTRAANQRRLARSAMAKLPVAEMLGDAISEQNAREFEPQPEMVQPDGSNSASKPLKKKEAI